MIRRLPIIILAAYFVLAMIYSVVTPMFESPDEDHHFGFIQRLAQSWDLPDQNSGEVTAWGQEGSQPPLYYLLASLVVRLAPADFQVHPLALNPHAEVGVGLARINHNTFVHTSDEVFPWHGNVLRLHLARLLSVILGGCTVYAVYRTAQLTIPDHPAVALVAMAFIAFNPMFVFLSASANNDNLVTTFGALASWLILLILRQGFTPRRIALLAVVLACASLSKLSGLTFYPVAGVLLIVLLIKQRIMWVQLASAVGALVGAFVVVAGWWYLRNVQLYGDVTGLSAMLVMVGPRMIPYTPLTMLNEMDGLRISFWGLFGWFNVIEPNWFLMAMDYLTAAALIGVTGWLIYQLRARRWEIMLPLGILGLQFLVTFASLINWTRITPGTQGRLLFPAMASIATLTALGWYAIASAVKVKSLVALPVLLMAGVTVTSPFLVIAPAYAPPPVVARLPDGAIPIDVRFDKINVVGFQIDSQPVAPGDLLPVTVYYRGEPDPRNLSLYLTALDPSGQLIGKIDSFPGGGNLPTQDWKQSVIYSDSYLIPITSDAPGPAQFRIEFGWRDFARGALIKAVNGDGNPLEALILNGGSLLATDPPSAPTIKQTAVFSGALRLNGYTLSPGDGVAQAGKPLEINLVWEGLAQVHEDFTVFVHIVSPDGKMVAQDDSPPRRGDYPTSAWAPSRPFVDSHSVKIDAPGTYSIVIGLYRPGDGSRLPINSGRDALTLQTTITVK